MKGCHVIDDPTALFTHFLSSFYSNKNKINPRDVNHSSSPSKTLISPDIYSTVLHFISYKNLLHEKIKNL